MPEKKVDKVRQQLQKSLNKITAERVKVLENFKNLQVLNHVLLQREERRLSRKLGPEHARVKQLKHRLNHNQDRIRDLGIELEIAHIEVPAVSSKDALIHGRITDSNLRGINGLIVFLQDEGGKVIHEVASSKTESYGYYALKLGSSAITELRKRKHAFLAVRNEKGKAVFNDPDPLIISEGDRLIEEVELNRKDLGLVRVYRPNKKREENNIEGKQPLSSDVWVVRGSVAYDEGKSIEGVTVSLYDKDLLFDDLLGTTKIDENGNFKLSYESKDFSDLFEKKPDLYLKVIDPNGKVIYSTKEIIRFEAGKEEVFEIIINKHD